MDFLSAVQSPPVSDSVSDFYLLSLPGCPPDLHGLLLLHPDSSFHLSAINTPFSIRFPYQYISHCLSVIHLENKSCRRPPGYGSIGISPSFQTGPAYTRKYHYQKQHHRRRVPVTLLIIRSFSLVPFLQYPRQYFFVFHICHFATRCRKVADTGSHGASVTQLRCFIRPAGSSVFGCQGTTELAVTGISSRLIPPVPYFVPYSPALLS